MRVALFVTGVVQGVGFRPFAYGLAKKYGLSGWIKNGRAGVNLEISGTSEGIEQFCHALRSELPAPGNVEHIEQRTLEENEVPFESFRILPSDEARTPRALLPPDLAICAECRDEVRTPSDRRFGYALTCCARCGPRYSLVEELPYDRSRTGMRVFELCAACAREYEDPTNRRFHAEPLACPQCGPRVSLLAANGDFLVGDEEAIRIAAQKLRNGDIVAFRGMGGYQLLAEATDGAVITKLRQRKLRQEKPFAVLFPNIEMLVQHAFVSPEERDVLMGSQRPIVLVHKRPTSTIVPEVAPRCPLIGAMLPATAMHLLLCEAVGKPLVCTSGNLSGEPLCVETNVAINRLGNVADFFLTHNRPIVRPVDDSVVRAGPRGIHVLRRARGYSPLPVFQLDEKRCILGLGAQLKNTISLVVQGQVIMSQHLGDMDDPDSVDLLSRTVLDLTRFYDVRPEIIASDLHPDFASTLLARRLVTEWNAKWFPVQHHHAHVAAVMAERNVQHEVFALVWDGYGFGADGQAWGGESFIVGPGVFRRVGSLKRFVLPGGDKAAEEPWRSALGLLEATRKQGGADLAKRLWPDKPTDTLWRMMERGFSWPWTSSMGRLFDAIGAILGIRAVTTFEGQAAMELEWIAATNESELPEPYDLPIIEGSPWIADTTPLVEGILRDQNAGRPVAEMAARFIASLVDLGLRSCQRAKLPQVVLAGGCFQNDLLTRALVPRLERSGFQVLLPAKVPINDGGISAGQVAVVSQMGYLAS